MIAGLPHGRIDSASFRGRIGRIEQAVSSSIFSPQLRCGARIPYSTACEDKLGLAAIRTLNTNAPPRLLAS